MGVSTASTGGLSTARGYTRLSVRVNHGLHRFRHFLRRFPNNFPWVHKIYYIIYRFAPIKSLTNKKWPALCNPSPQLWLSSRCRSPRRAAASAAQSSSLCSQGGQRVPPDKCRELWLRIQVGGRGAGGRGISIHCTDGFLMELINIIQIDP